MQEYPKIITPLPGPKTQALIARDQKVLSPSYTRSYPLSVARAHGLMVEDLDGNRFMDFVAGVAVCATGHCHPQVIQAAKQQMDALIHIAGTDFYYEPQVQLAEKLIQITPGNFPKKVFFTNSGTESVEAAMKLARYTTGRKKFIAFKGCFHGRTFGSLSLTMSKEIQRQGFDPFVPEVIHMPYGYCYHCPHTGKPSTCPIDNGSMWEELFSGQLDPNEVAAIFVEPIQGEGGYVLPPPEFLHSIQKVCQKHGILLVADEIQSGMGRTGKMFACEHFNIEPDIVCVAKGIASGFPLGAIIARADLMTWPSGAHANTFGGNPVACAAALATLSLIENQLLANAATQGAYLLKQLKAWQANQPQLGDVRGLGLMVGLEWVEDKDSRHAAVDFRNHIVQKAFERGLIVLGCGKNVL